MLGTSFASDGSDGWPYNASSCSTVVMRDILRLNSLLVLGDDGVALRLTLQHPHHLLRLFGAIIHVAFDGQPRHVRRADEVVALEQRMVQPRGLLLPYIAGGAFDGARLERLGQRQLVEH